MRSFTMVYKDTEYIVSQLHDESPAVVKLAATGDYVTMVWPFPGLGARQEIMEEAVREHLSGRSNHDHAE